MKKSIFYFLLLITTQFVFGQKPIEHTNEIIIFGLIENPIKINFADILKQESDSIGNFKVTNHTGEFRKEYKNVKGVQLLDLIQNLKIKEANPKLLSEYYFVFKASDNYSVVASWNELFNTEIGASFYIVVEADGKSLQDATESILLICTKDFKTGRRHIKGLKSIEVKRI